MEEFFPVFVLGLGKRARKVIQDLKARVENEGGHYPLVYLAVSAEELDAPPLNSRLEDYKLGHQRGGVPLETLLDRYGPLARGEWVEGVLSKAYLTREGFYNALANGLLDLSDAQKHGSMAAGDRVVDFYFVVDLADPLCLTLGDWVSMLRQLSSRYHLAVHPFLLSLGITPFAYPIIQWLGTQFTAPLQPGAILIEGTNEQGYSGSERERLAALAEWLFLRIHNQPRRDRLPSLAGLGSWGIAQGQVPKSALNRFLVLQWGSEFLEQWTVVSPMGPLLDDTVRQETWKPFLNLVKEPEHTTYSGPNYGCEVQGNLLPPPDVQQSHARLYREGENRALRDHMIEDLHFRIDVQARHSYPNFVRNLVERGEGIARASTIALQFRLEKSFGVSLYPFAETLDFIKSTRLTLEAVQRQAKDQVDYLRALEDKGLYQENPPSSPSIFQQVWAGLLAMLIILMAVEGLFVGVRTLLSFWPAFQEQPVLAALAVLGLFLFIALIAYDIRVLLNWYLHHRARIVVFFFLLPLPFDLLNLILWHIIINLGIDLLLILGQAWPTFQLYELSFIAPLRRVQVAENYVQARTNAEASLGHLSLRLMLYRFALMLSLIVIVLVIAHPVHDGGLGDLVQTFPWAWPRWLWPVLVLCVVMLSKYFFVDVASANGAAVGKLVIPIRGREWLASVATMVILGWAVMLVFGFIWGLPGQEWLYALSWGFAVTLVALLRFGMEYLNDRERLTLLANEWVHWHEAMSYLHFHQEAWTEALAIYRSIEEKAKDLQTQVEALLATLMDLKQDWCDTAALQMEQIKRLLEMSSFPRYILRDSPDSLYPIVREKAADLSKTLIEQYGREIWQARPEPRDQFEEILREDIKNVIESEMEPFWQAHGILSQFPPPMEWPADEKYWFLEPAHPFWTNANWKLDSRVYLGLPFEAAQNEELCADIERVMLLPREREYYEAQPPTRFPTDPWTITGIYFRIGAAPSDLKSWPVWEQQYQEALSRFQHGPANDFPECPWCNNPIYPLNDPSGPSKVCPECGLVQHEAHWNENAVDGKGCARMGCALQAPAPG